MRNEITLSLPCDVAEIALAAEAVERFCDDNNIPPKIAFDFNLAIDELATNTILYSFEGTDGGELRLAFGLSGDGWVEARLDDNGAAYDPFTQAPPPVLEGGVEDRPIGGLGVYFVKKLMDEAVYRRENGWNRITLRRRLDRL